VSISPGRLLNRWALYASWAAFLLLLFAKPLFQLIHFAWQDDTASHILLIPFISAWLLYSDPKGEVSSSGFEIRPALFFLISAIFAALLPIAACSSCSARDRLSLLILSFILLLVGGFVLLLGSAKAKTSSFALGFLVFMIPIPDFLLSRIIYWLQAGSADIAEVIFDLSGAPVLRNGFVFHLPNVSIEVAQECSGIRSSLALLILALLVAHFSFRSTWKIALFVVAGLAMMLVKNGIRIATLTLLAAYVNPEFLYGRLHRQGGVVFFLISLALLWPLYWYLRKGESSLNTGSRPVGEVLRAEK
jgi:exosortase